MRRKEAEAKRVEDEKKRQIELRKEEDRRRRAARFKQFRMHISFGFTINL